MPGTRVRRRTAHRERRRAARRHALLAVASAVVAIGATAGLIDAGHQDGRDTARPGPTPPPVLQPLPAVPTPTAPAPSASSARPAPAAPSPSRTTARPSAAPTPPPARPTAPAPAPRNRLFRHPHSQVLDWVRANPDDPRRPVIESRIAAQPAAVWFAAHNPGEIAGQVRAVTRGAAAAGRTPVLVPYAIPDRDCGGASQGGAPDLAAYDAWIREFARGLGAGAAIVILEPDAIALSDCLTAPERAARFASLARAGRTLRTADPRARVYFDGGHSGWHTPAKQAAALRAAGAATNGDGIFTNVANFHRTADETAYARRVLTALGGPARLGAVIDTSRNGNGAPAAGEWCDPAGRALGRTPTTRTGEARIDAYLWVKLPGESDGCSAAPGSFTPEYAYSLATG
ncbi:endoglucanase [Streptomyces sp. TSRI0445]|uniref:glycoside hydrolase family 6 protein n=1 Tax=Streptomyces TaxID=1883 RepID=UPI0005C87673|nr:MULTISPECIES: glycoside hydrolase family 6 protein [Streptomyces]PPA43395.1 endoglucanase [Streptomyces griseus]RAN20654.1 endoglucanase [Streptomyces badius]AWL89477.1 endoglucanase [Streptomyces globisporus]OKI64691.1 endoglucanase [Streptomyces sp. TSRI0445]RAN28579.1 endoglucanase [Streptomyces badius]